MARQQTVVKLRADDILGGRYELSPHQQNHGPADNECHGGEHAIQKSDILVIDRRNPADESTWLLFMDVIRSIDNGSTTS